MSPDGRRLSKRDHDLDLGAIRDRGVSPRRVIGRLAGLVGLAEQGEELSPTELLPRFCWGKVRARRDNAIVTDDFLL